MKSSKKFAVLLILLCASAAGCTGSGRSPVPHAATPTPVQADETVTLKLMSFNVLFGAGVDRRFDEHIPPRFQDRDRLPELLEFLRAADPDVLAIEEAAGWNEGSPSPADQVAEALGMKYVIAKDEWELHIVLFSKYPILDSYYASRFQGFNGVVLQATLAVTPTSALNLIATHLNSMSPLTRSCQVGALLDIASLRPGRTVLMGDMNFRPGSSQAHRLSTADWQLIAAQERWPIDQVWADPLANLQTGDWWQQQPQLEGVSDHYPVGVDLTISLPRADQPLDLPLTPVAPAALDYVCALP